MTGILIPLILGFFILQLAPKILQLTTKRKKKKTSLYLQIAGMVFILLGVLNLIRFIF